MTGILKYKFLFHILQNVILLPCDLKQEIPQEKLPLNLFEFTGKSVTYGTVCIIALIVTWSGSIS